MKSSIVKVSQLPASHKRTLYFPEGLYFLLSAGNKSSTNVGNSAKQAMAHKNQQSPNAPCKMSPGSIFPSNTSIFPSLKISEVRYHATSSPAGATPDSSPEAIKVGLAEYNEGLMGLKSGSMYKFLGKVAPGLIITAISFSLASATVFCLTASGSSYCQSYSTSKRAPFVGSTKLTVPKATLPEGGTKAAKAMLGTDLPVPSTAAKFILPLKFIV